MFFFIIGEDNVSELITWYKYEYLLEHLKFIVFTRNLNNAGKWRKLNYLEKLTFYEMEPINVSSTEIRTKIRNNQPITGLVPNLIENEILQLKKYFK